MSTQQLYSQFLEMDKGTPKSYKSTAQKSKLLTSTSSYFDRDVEIQKQYLQKLKSQRMKAQKLYTQYKMMLSDRNRLQSQKQHLQEELNSLRKKVSALTQESKTQWIKIQSLNQRLEQQNRNLRNKELECMSIKHHLQIKIKDFQSQIEMYQREDQEKRQTIQQLQEEVHLLESENERIKNEYDEQIHNLQNKINQLENNYQRVVKESQNQKEAYNKSKNLWEQEREQINQTITLKTQQLKSLKTDFQLKINEKDRLYQIVVTEMQDGKIFMKTKIEEKNREINTLKKNWEILKEENRKLKSQTLKEREKFRDTQDREFKLKQSLSQSTKNLSKKQSEYCQLHEKYLKGIEESHSLELLIQELESKLKKCQETNRRCNENCQEYLKIIEKMQKQEQRRLLLAQSEYQEINKMEDIFSKFQ